MRVAPHHNHILSFIPDLPQPNHTTPTPQKHTSRSTTLAFKKEKKKGEVHRLEVENATFGHLRIGETQFFKKARVWSPQRWY